MIYILLDIDGVLNTVSQHVGGIGPSHVRVLYLLLATVQSTHFEPVKLVLSSNWRMSAHAVYILRSTFAGIGWRIHSTTPLPPSHLTDPKEKRVYTILQWASQTIRPGDKWVAIDDLPCHELGQEHFHWIDPRVGLQLDDVPIICNKLLRR